MAKLAYSSLPIRYVVVEDLSGDPGPDTVDGCFSMAGAPNPGGPQAASCWCSSGSALADYARRSTTLRLRRARSRLNVSTTDPQLSFGNRLFSSLSPPGRLLSPLTSLKFATTMFM
jgi:hypothetical protein